MSCKSLPGDIVCEIPERGANTTSILLQASDLL